MAKLNIDYNLLQSFVISNMDNCINDLDSAINKSGMSNIPNDFRYFSYLNNLKTNIAKNRDQLNNIKSGLISSNFKIDNAISDISSNINSINTVKINRRETIVK